MDDMNASQRQPLTVVATFAAIDGAVDALRAALEHLADASRGDEGCLSYDLTRDIENDRVFAFVERWESEDSWRRHLAAPHTQAFAARMTDLVAESNMHALRSEASP